MVARPGITVCLLIGWLASGYHGYSNDYRTALLNELDVAEGKRSQLLGFHMTIDCMDFVQSVELSGFDLSKSSFHRKMRSMAKCLQIANIHD